MENEDNYSPNVKVIGINLIILAIYTLIFRFEDSGIIFDAFLLAIQFIVCIFMGIIKQKWIWVLAALVVLIIGFSTCVSFSGIKL